ncbi:MAG TPA: GNAT family N-acetyltransferase, partial [Anaerolineaceae bacterium]
LRDVDDFQRGYVENGGVFLVLREGDQIIGTGALRRYDGHTGEIKRVWLLPDYHGQGLGYRLMQALLGVARDYGYTKVRLQTSPSFQPRAFLFYQQLGFIEIPAYGDDPDDVGMELTLT